MQAFHCHFVHICKQNIDHVKFSTENDAFVAAEYWRIKRKTIYNQLPQQAIKTILKLPVRTYFSNIPEQLIVFTNASHTLNFKYIESPYP